jgi:hypothetical protein
VGDASSDAGKAGAVEKQIIQIVKNSTTIRLKIIFIN